MKNRIPKNPVLLATFLGNLIEGDKKHQQDGPLPKEVRADLDKAKSELDSLNSSVQLSKGQYHQDTQERREYVTELQAEKFRDAVFGKVGHKDAILVDYGLAVRRKANRGTEEGVKPSAALKAERAQVRLAKAQAKLEKAKAQMPTLESRVAKWEAEAAKAALVTPHEPTPVAETPPVTQPTTSTDKPTT